MVARIAGPYQIQFLRKGCLLMASYVSCPRDLSKIKTKIAFNLTKRQLICFGLAALVGFPVFFLLRKTGNMTLAGCGMVFTMLPFFVFAMYEKDGRTLEYVLRDMIETLFLRPRIRPYRTENFYEDLCRAAQTEKEVNRIGKKMTKEIAIKLLEHSRVLVRNCKSQRTNKNYDAEVCLTVQPDGKANYHLEFPVSKKEKKKPKK